MPANKGELSATSAGWPNLPAVCRADFGPLFFCLPGYECNELHPSRQMHVAFASEIKACDPAPSIPHPPWRPL